MAATPAAPLANWLGTGAGTGVVTTTAGSHFVIPKLGVQAYVGNDAVLTDDIRDFLHSCLAKTYEVYSQPRSGTDNAPTGFTITQNLVKVGASEYRVIYTVSINGIASLPSNSLTISALPTYA